MIESQNFRSFRDYFDRLKRKKEKTKNNSKKYFTYARYKNIIIAKNSRNKVEAQDPPNIAQFSHYVTWKKKESIIFAEIMAETIRIIKIGKNSKKKRRKKHRERFLSRIRRNGDLLNAYGQKKETAPQEFHSSTGHSTFDVAKPTVIIH